MKKNLFLSLMLFAIMASLSACHDDENESASRSLADSPEALAYCKAHKTELLQDIFSRMALDEERPDPVTNNPDITRECLIPIGYDGLNVKGFLEAGAYLDSLVVDSLVRKAVLTGNKTALLITGSSSSGKSTALKTTPYLKSLRKQTGFVSDQTFESFATLEGMVKMLRANGFENKDITIAMIYCDAPTSYFSACSRLYRTGRSISLDYFADVMYPCFIGRTQSLYATFGATNPIVYLDNTKYQLKALTNEDGTIIGYTGADESACDTWVYYNAMVADEFTDVSKGGKLINSEADLPKASPATATTASHWYYELSADDRAHLKELADVWERAGKEPYEYAQKNMPWFNWTYDFYVPQYPGDHSSDKPDATYIDWSLYPTDGVKCPFYATRNADKAKRSLYENLSK
ncbi:MAG: hypothetical protein Q4F34_04100 [Prevotellaceae bacterium]|nr:hypothetical protein [Prevotellaceae bacterium]